MKKILLITLLFISLAVNAQTYKLYQTHNIHNQLKLNTITGEIYQIQGTLFLTCKDVYKCANYQRADELIKQRIEVFEKFKKKYPVDIWFRNKG